MGIELKSIGFLIDELSVTNIRCWFAQEKNFEINGQIERGELAADDPEAFRLKAEAADLAQKTNARRSALIRAIDNYFSDPNVALAKSYGKSESEKPEMIEFDPDRLMIFGGEPKFNYAAGNLPVIYDHDKMVKAVTYAYQNSYSMSVTVYGEFYWRDSCEVTGFDSPNFENFILAYDWLYEEAMKHE